MARLLFSTGSLYVHDTAHCFALAAEAGFDGIEVMADSRWSSRDPRYLTHLMQRHDLPVMVVHTPFSTRVPGWDDSSHLRLIEQTITLAEALGAESIVVHLPQFIGRAWLNAPFHSLMLPARSPFRDVRRWMQGEGLRAAQANTAVRIAVENMPNSLLPVLGRVNLTRWNSVRAWAKVHQWLTLDTTHWATRGVDPTEAFDAAQGRVTHIHLSNYDSAGVGTEHRLPHRGDIDLAAFLRRLRAAAYDGTLSLELHPDALAFTDEDAMRTHLAESVAFCREHLGQGAGAGVPL